MILNYLQTEVNADTKATSCLVELMYTKIFLVQYYLNYIFIKKNRDGFSCGSLNLAFYKRRHRVKVNHWKEYNITDIYELIDNWMAVKYYHYPSKVEKIAFVRRSTTPWDNTWIFQDMFLLTPFDNNEFTYYKWSTIVFRDNKIFFDYYPLPNRDKDISNNLRKSFL